MARGDYGFNQSLYPLDEDILFRGSDTAEAVPMTIDFSDVEADANGIYKVPGGTPISAAGAPLTGYSTAVGVLRRTVYKDYPNGAILKKGYIDCAKAATLSGITWDSTFRAGLKALLPMIEFENFT